MFKNLLILMIIFLSYESYTQTDPNNDPNWDWTASSTFTVYPQALGYQINTTSPFYQGGISEAVFDNKPEDGWVLLMRDFGTPTRNATVPYFALYNKYEGILRIFTYVVINGAYTKGFINIYWGTTLKTAALTFLKNTAWGINTLDSTKNNSSASYGPIVNANWAFADFPIAYEYNASSYTNPRFHFETWGSTTSNVNLTIQGDILQHFGNNQPANLPSPGFFQEGGTFQLAQKHVQGTQSTWTGWKTVIDNIGKGIDSNTTSSALLNLKNSIKALSSSWTVSNLGAIGAAVGLLDFFITGGRLTEKEKPAPMNFKANFTADGTISTNVQVAGAVTMPLPGSNITSTGTATNLLYNHPLGILNLHETPIVEHRKYDQPEGQGITRETHSFRIKNDLIFDLNPNSDLEIDSIKAALVYVPVTKPMAQEFLGYADQGYSNIDNTPIELESATDSVFEFRTPYINAYSVKYQKITIPTEALNNGFNVEGGEWIPFNMPLNIALGKVYLKIHATLKVKNSSVNRQPVVFVATYNVINQEGDGVNAPWPTPPQPVTLNISGNYEFDGVQQQSVGYGFAGEQKQIAALSDITVNSKGYKFSYWTDNNSRSNPRTVTPTDNTTYTAYYKAHLYSNLSTATTTNSQRKIVQSSSGDWAMVYTSSDKIWLSRSTDGTNWDKEIKISDDGKVDGYPSIAISGNLAYIVWQGIDWAGSGFDVCAIYMRSYDLSNNTLGSTATLETFTPNIEAFQANPVIDGYWDQYNDNKMIAWREPNGIKVKEYDDNNAWSSVGSVSGTNGYSYNPSIAAFDGNIYYLCWEDRQNVYYGKIKYIEASYYQSWSFTNSYNVSPTDWESNANPQITSINNKPTVVWSSRNNVAEGIPSVHVRQRVSGTWGSITSFTYSSNTSATPAPVIADYPNGSNKMDVLWNIGNTVFKGSYNGSSWTGPTTVTTSGGTGVSINKSTSYQTKALWKKSDNTIAFYDVGGTAPPKMAVSTQNKEIILPYRLNRHAIVELDKGIDSTARGSVCFEIAGMSSLLDNNQTKINYSANDNSMSSEPFKVAVPGMELNFRGAIYGKGLEFSNKLVSSISEPLAKVVLKDSKSGKVLKDIWTNSSSMLNSVKDKTFGEFRETNVNLNNFLGKTVYVEVELLGKSKNVKPIIDNDYLILSDSASSENNLGKTAVVYDLPSDYKLMQNYPNPFNPSTTISFYLPESRHVTLKVYNTLGKEIMTAANGNMEQGFHAVNLDMSNESSGIYFYTLQAGNFRDTKKLLLLK